MNRRYKIFKRSSGPSTGKALLNHTIFSPSQTGETVPLSKISWVRQLNKKDKKKTPTNFKKIPFAVTK
jgi:hypothetical protein